MRRVRSGSAHISHGIATHAARHMHLSPPRPRVALRRATPRAGSRNAFTSSRYLRLHSTLGRCSPSTATPSRSAC